MMMFNLTLTTSEDQPQQTMSLPSNCVPASEVALSNNDKTAEFYVQIIFGLVYTVIFFLGVTGNVLVIVSVRQNRALQSVRNMFIVSLSCSDIAVCLTSVLITPITTMAKNWLFGKITCYVFPLFQGMSICISAFTLTAIAIDRYILIVHPTHPAISQTAAVCIIVGIWVLGASVTLPVVAQSQFFTMEDDPPYYLNETNEEMKPCGYFCGERWTSDESKKLYGTVLLLVQFVFPLSIITYCYSRISLRLSDAYAKRMLNHHGPLTDRQRALLRRKQRTNIMLISMVVVFAACWFFQVLINLLNDYEKTPEFVVGQQWLYGLVCHVIAMTSTFWNPVLYAGLNEGFRAAFIELLPCLDGGIYRKPSGEHGQRFACNAETFRLRAHSPMLINELTNWHYNNNDKTAPIANV